MEDRTLDSNIVLEATANKHITQTIIDNHLSSALFDDKYSNPSWQFSHGIRNTYFKKQKLMSHIDHCDERWVKGIAEKINGFFRRLCDTIQGNQLSIFLDMIRALNSLRLWTYRWRTHSDKGRYQCCSSKALTTFTKCGNSEHGCQNDHVGRIKKRKIQSCCECERNEEKVGTIFWGALTQTGVKKTLRSMQELFGNYSKAEMKLIEEVYIGYSAANVNHNRAAFETICHK